MTTLLIETATNICSVALYEDGTVVARRDSNEANAHSTCLASFVSDIFEQTQCRGRLNAVCVSSGPGSYTGLRIGVSTAKGICYGLGIPLLAVPTLQSMANLYFVQHPNYEGWVCPMIDARRLECYTAFFSREGQIRHTMADIIVEGIYDSFLDNHQVVFVGDGAAKTKPLLGGHPNAAFDDSFVLSAEGLVPAVQCGIDQRFVVDVAYFEPFYLKDFVAKRSEVHGLR